MMNNQKIHHMNHFDKINRKTDKIFENILDKDTYGIDSSINWSNFIKIAAIIRVWLYNIITEKNGENKPKIPLPYCECIENYTGIQIIAYIHNGIGMDHRIASAAIDRARYFHGIKDSKTGSVLDYSSPIEYSNQSFEMTILTGERFFLYNCFKKIYTD